MQNLIFMLLGANAVFFVFAALRGSISRRGVEVNHEALFGAGLLFYWIFPILVGLFHLYPNSPGMAWWHLIFQQIAPEQLARYLGYTLLIGLSFYLGSRFGRRPIAELRRLGSGLVFDRRLLILYFGLALLPAAYYLYAFKDLFFTGYRGLNWSEASKKGSFVATGNLVLGLAWIYVLQRKLRGGLTLKQTFANPYTAFYLVLGVLILSLGGRLYFASSIVMFVVFYTLHFRRLGLGKSLLGLVFFLVLLGLLGIWRDGSAFSLARTVFILAVESLYTGFSLVSYLAENSLNIFNTPIFLLSSFIALVPTPLYPDKGERILDPNDFGFDYIAPIGAMNSFVSLDINFGALGGALLFFVLGFVLSQFKAQRAAPLAQVVYIMSCGFLPLTFFRDPYSISLVKNWFQFSFLLPLLLVFFVHALTLAARRQRERAQA